MGSVCAGGREDVGLGDEPLQGEVVGQEGGAVLGLVRVGWCLFGVGDGLRRGAAGVGWPGGLGRESAISEGKMGA